MVNRSNLFEWVIAAAACIASPSFAEEAKPIDINQTKQKIADVLHGPVESSRVNTHPTIDVNGTLKKIAEVLRACPEVAHVEEYVTDSAAKGLVHWRWMHYHYDIQNDEVPRLERVNKELLSAMQTARTIPHSGLDALRLEGLVEGKVAQQIEEYRNNHRTLMKLQFTVPITFGLGLHIQPAEEFIDREINVTDNLYKPVLQTTGPDDNPETSRFMWMSPLARLGAGYILSTLHGTELLPMEDPYIDARAAMAERSRSESIRNYWILHQRNTHAVKLGLESDRDIENFLLGANHRLGSYIEESNDQHDKKISSLRVTVKSLKRM